MSDESEYEKFMGEIDSTIEESNVVTLGKPLRLNLTTIDFGDLLNREFPPRENILAPWLPTQGLCMIYAGRGVGKTHMALGVAYAVSSGGEFLGWVSDKPRKVVYIDGEMPVVTMQERLAAITAAAPTEPLPGHLKLINPDLQEQYMPDLASKEGQAAIAPHLEGVDLIIVDNISTLCRSGAENKADDWGMVQEWALLQRSRGRSVLFIHHAGKGGAQRGTSKREDVLDTVINLRHPSDYSPEQGAKFEIHFEKSRGVMGDAVRSMLASLTIDHQCVPRWYVETLEESTYSRVIDLYSEGLSQKEIAEEVGINKSNVSRKIRKAKSEGLVSKKEGRK
ncbi:MAG: AAA family ATPase [Candidatus Sedimenticola sp. (ex Thyasira tokunagai)]